MRQGDLSALLASRLEPLGFEVLGSVNVGTYNQSLTPAQERFRLAGIRGDEDAVFVIGSTRRLWPLFLHAHATTSLREATHPFDEHSRVQIGGVASAVAQELGLRHSTRYSFDRTPAIAIQRLAALSGGAELGPVGLCVHPEWGPWFSLRAAVVFGVDSSAAGSARPTCSTCESRPCLAARAEILSRDPAAFDEGEVRRNWKSWLAVRDACPVGREARYGEAQIRYHYLKDRSALAAAGTPVGVSDTDV